MAFKEKRERGKKKRKGESRRRTQDLKDKWFW